MRPFDKPLTKELLLRNGWIEKPGMIVLKTPKVRVSWILKSHELIVGYGLMPEPVETVSHLKAYLRCIGLKDYAKFK